MLFDSPQDGEEFLCEGRVCDLADPLLPISGYLGFRAMLEMSLIFLDHHHDCNE